MISTVWLEAKDVKREVFATCKSTVECRKRLMELRSAQPPVKWRDLAKRFGENPGTLYRVMAGKIAPPLKLLERMNIDFSDSLHLRAPPGMKLIKAPPPRIRRPRRYNNVRWAVTAYVECVDCKRQAERSGGSKESVANQLGREGWQFLQFGPMCPDCCKRMVKP